MNPSAGHILVVDDVADNRGLLVQLLRHDGHRVTEAADGAEALALIASERPDVVLLDLMMPHVDGFAVLERLQRADAGFLPVLVVTASADRESRLRALKLGAQDFLCKPVDPQELVCRVRTQLALKQADQRLRAQAEALQEANARLRRHSDRVEAEVVARTEALQQAYEELAHANERLVQADRYKDEFLAVISHELRTPLNFIMGFASVLADELSGPLNDLQQDQIGKVLNGADRMLLLVNDLLDFARMRAGDFRVEPEPVDLPALVEEAIGALRPVAEQKGIHLSAFVEVQRRPELDGHRLVQVLTNLVGNALKFTPAGGYVTVRAKERKDTLVLDVIDTGCGIAAQDLPKLFTRFQQLDMGNTRRAGGVGLGLSISDALVKAHGGRIEVTSELGRGSTFSVKLPFAPNVPSAPRASAARR